MAGTADRVLVRIVTVCLCMAGLARRDTTCLRVVGRVGLWLVKAWQAQLGMIRRGVLCRGLT